MDLSFILLFIALAIIGCVASVFFGYQMGKIKRGDDSGKDYEDYDEYDEPMTTPLASSEMPYPPPPPPPPPPPEDFLGPLDNEIEGNDGGPEKDWNEYHTQTEREIVDSPKADSPSEEAQINGEKIPEIEESNE